MRKNLRCLLGLLLALAMVLSLTACGEKSESNPEGGGSSSNKSEEHPEMVYTYEIHKLSSDQLEDGIYPMVFTEDGFYGETYEAIKPQPLLENEENGEDDTESENETEEDEMETYSEVLYFVGYNGDVTRLDAYVGIPAPVDSEDKLNYYSGSSLNALALEADGGLIAVENAYAGWFDGTQEEMMRDTPDTWEKYRSVQEYYVRRLNPDGSEKSSVKLDFQTEDAWLSFGGCQFLDDGSLLVPGDSGIYRFSADGSLACQISCEEVYPENLLKTGDGTIYALGWNEKGYALYPLDLEKKSLGKPIQVPNNAYNPKGGDKNYDFYYVDGMNLYGYRIADDENVKILNWLDVDINGYDLGNFYFRQDGSLMCVMNLYKNDHVETELVRVYQAPYDSVPHKQTLTLALLYGYNIYQDVVDFNRHNDKVRIQVLDYSEYNDDENEDYDAGRTKLLTEIMSGQMPDMLLLDQLPYRQLASKGLLEDLYPYIDSDPELKREDYFPNVLQAMEVNGGLYQITSGFNIQTLIGATQVVGDKPGWTYQELQNALATMPEGCDAMDLYTTRGDLLQTLLCADLNHYVDWTEGKCYFDSQDFIDLLEFTARFPAEIPDDLEWESTTTRLAQGRQMLTSASLYSVDSIIWQDVQFGEKGCTYIGYPTNEGVGSYMYLSTGYAMSSKCSDKEAAWAFMRSVITEDAQRNSWDGIPLSLKVYREKLEQAMTPEYQTDEKGNYLLDEKGQKIPQPIGSIWMEGGEEYMVYNMTQEQADKLWEAVSTCTKLMESDNAIYDIVFEQAQAFYSGQKSAQDVAKLIQSKVTIYVNEQR